MWVCVGDFEIVLAGDEQGGERCEGGGPAGQKTFTAHAFTALLLPYLTTSIAYRKQRCAVL